MSGCVGSIIVALFLHKVLRYEKWMMMMLQLLLFHDMFQGGGGTNMNWELNRAFFAHHWKSDGANLLFTRGSSNNFIILGSSPGKVDDGCSFIVAGYRRSF